MLSLLSTASHIKEHHDGEDSEQSDGTDNTCRICRIRSSYHPKLKVLRRTTNDSPNVRPSFRIIRIVRGARHTGRGSGDTRHAEVAGSIVKAAVVVAGLDGHGVRVGICASAILEGDGAIEGWD